MLPGNKHCDLQDEEDRYWEKTVYVALKEGYLVEFDTPSSSVKTGNKWKLKAFVIQYAHTAC